jgi:acetoin:2,6-dichlorophenolindophenol oxidoreductase subunit alpha
MKSKNWASDVYERLLKIRLTEEAVSKEYSQQEMKCPVHLSIGQEAVAVGISVCLEPKDIAFSTHRCHSHYLAKGGDLNGMIAELYGKRTGCAGGLGGSMHLVDETVGFLGASAIVGGSIPLAVGAALTFSMSNEPRVAVVFFGDGAVEEGVFYESMNFAALKKLPVIFVCENNFVATSSSLSARKSKDNVFQHGEIFGIPGFCVDGNDVLAMYEASEKAVSNARNGNGPALIEARTFRMMGHVGPKIDQTSGDRTLDEWNRWREKCPLIKFEGQCDAEGLLTLQERETMRRQVQEKIEQAFHLAQVAPFPEPVS